MKKITAILTAMVVLSLLLVPFAGISASALGITTTEFQFHIESFTVDGYPAAELGGAKGDFIYYTEDVVFHDSIAISGWMVSAEGNWKLEYSVDGGSNWTDGEVRFTDRKDLAGAGIPYPDSHAAAAFSLTIPSSAFTAERDSVLDLRVVTLEENYIEFLSFRSVTYIPGEVEFKFQYRVSLDGVGNGSVVKKGGANTCAEAAANINAGENVTVLGWAVSNLGIYKYELTVNGGAPVDVTENLRKRGDVLNAFPSFTSAQGNNGEIGFGRDDDYMILPGINRLPAGEYEVILRAMIYDDFDTTFDVVKLTLFVTGELPETEPPTEAPTAEPTAAPTEAPTAAPTEAPTAAPTEPAATAAPETKAAEEKKGCKSVVSAAVVLVAIVGCAVVAKKK